MSTHVQDDPHDDTLSQFQALLDSSRHASSSTVDLAKLRTLCSNGIPQHPSHLRPLAYSLLLGVLPVQKREWKHVSKTQRAHYYGLVRTHMEHIEDLPESAEPIERLISNITRDVASAQSRFAFLSYTLPSSTAPLAPTRRKDRDHAEDLVDDDFSSSSSSDDQAEHLARRTTHRPPRPLQISSRRAMFERLDAVPECSYDPTHALSPQITLSSVMTPQLSLSASSSGASPVTLLKPRKINNGTVIYPDSHAEAIARMVYVFVQTNSQWAYHQGLIDIAAHLYLVYSEIQWKFKTRRGERSRVPVPRAKYAEERTYWAFCALVREYDEVLVGKDGSQMGKMLDCFERRARWSDGPMWSILTENEVLPSSYASRWFSLLLVADIPASFVLPAWDFILSDRAQTAQEGAALDALVDMCVAVLLTSRPIILATIRTSPRGLWGDAPTPHDAQRQMELLHALPLEQASDPESLLYVARQLRSERASISELDLFQAARTPSAWSYSSAMDPTSRLSSLSQVSSAWTSSAIASASEKIAELAGAHTIEAGWSSWRSWIRPKAPSAAAGPVSFPTVLQSPRTPPRTSGPKPLLLTSRRVSVTPQRQDPNLSTSIVPTLSPPTTAEASTSLYRINSRQASGRKRLSES